MAHYRKTIVDMPVAVIIYTVTKVERRLATACGSGRITHPYPTATITDGRAITPSHATSFVGLAVTVIVSTVARLWRGTARTHHTPAADQFGSSGATSRTASSARTFFRASVDVINDPIAVVIDQVAGFTRVGMNAAAARRVVAVASSMRRWPPRGSLSALNQFHSVAAPGVSILIDVAQCPCIGRRPRALLHASGCRTGGRGSAGPIAAFSPGDERGPSQTEHSPSGALGQDATDRDCIRCRQPVEAPHVDLPVPVLVPIVHQSAVSYDLSGDRAGIAVFIDTSFVADLGCTWGDPPVVIVAIEARPVARQVPVTVLVNPGLPIHAVDGRVTLHVAEIARPIRGDAIITTRHRGDEETEDRQNYRWHSHSHDLVPFSMKLTVPVPARRRGD